jgi:hypothetical protein
MFGQKQSWCLSSSQIVCLRPVLSSIYYISPTAPHYLLTLLEPHVRVT